MNAIIRPSILHIHWVLLTIYLKYKDGKSFFLTFVISC